MFLTLNQLAQLSHRENISSWDFLKYHHRYGAKDNWVTGLKHSACVAAADEWRMEGTEEQSPCMRTSRPRFNDLPVSPGVSRRNEAQTENSPSSNGVPTGLE